MKTVLLATLLLLPCHAFASKLLNANAPSYLPVFGLGSTTSVSFSQTLNGSVAAIQTTAGSATELVRVFTTAAAYVKLGTNPVPGSADMPIPANTEMILEVLAGQQIGAIGQASSGFLYVTHLVTFPQSN